MLQQDLTPQWRRDLQSNFGLTALRIRMSGKCASDLAKRDAERKAERKDLNGTGSGVIEGDV
jgi:hypothetical protein